MGFLLTGALALSLTACPSNPSTTAAETETETDTETDTDPSGTTEGPGTTTTPTEPVTTDPSTDPTTETSTTEPETTDPTTGSPAECGDGTVDEGEECDDGTDNGHDKACTEECKNAVCGDGFVYADGGEVCDDGSDSNGQYGFCNEDCSDLGPRCGDGEVQAEYEECDPTELMPMIEACNIESCMIAQDCKELFDTLPDEQKVSGMYPIKPEGQEMPLMPGAYCDMDNGGFTYVKWDDGGASSASEAQTKCNSMGLHLFWPTTPEHLGSAIGVAMNDMIAPVNGVTLADIGYLDILAIYPVNPGESCVDMPLNSNDCPEWAPPGGGEYFVGADPVPGQPGTNNCANCSISYTFDADMMVVTTYETFMNNGNGATSDLWLCGALP